MNAPADSTRKIVEQGLRAGLSDKEIARNADRAYGTIKIHVRHVMASLGVKNRTQAALRLRREP